MTRRSAVNCLSGLAASLYVPGARADDGPVVVRSGSSTIEVTFRSTEFDLPREAMIDWVSMAARAVSGYFGGFPVPGASLEIVMATGRRRGISGVTFGEGGVRTRVTVPQHATVQDLNRDWVLTHEMVHYGFPSMDEQHQWIEEGSATYIEPIARAAVGSLTVAQVWGDMVRDMWQGLPIAGDEGLDHTHTWGRTYWGGALYCLLADIDIREHSNRKMGLVDAFRAIRKAGGNIECDWSLERTLGIGDQATHGKSLITLYEKMAAQAVPVDLAALWKELGVRRENGQVIFDAGAPLAKVREAIAF